MGDGARYGDDVDDMIRLQYRHEKNCRAEAQKEKWKN